MTAQPLSFDDAFEILRPAFPDDSLVLVGGQAVSYWLTYYRDRDEQLAGMAGVTSDDVDFLGGLQAASRMANAIRGTLHGASVDDHGPNAAVVTFSDASGERRIIDFLWSVHGLESNKIRDAAVPVEVVNLAGARTGLEIRVLHPVHCLVSRVHNTNTFLKYQGERALRQLRAALGCARAYIRERLDVGEMRAAHRAIKIIGALAEERAGQSVHKRFGVCVLDAIPLDPRLGELCITKNLPHLRRRAGFPT